MGNFFKENDLNNELHLNALKKGMPGVTSALGEAFAEAAAICLESQKHLNGVNFEVKEDYQASLKIFWDSTDDQMKRTWKDDREATEFGACGMAFLLINKLTEYTVIERAVIGTRIDYWLGSKDNPQPFFQRKVRLEVSGIRSGTQAEINSRTKIKERQVDKSSATLLPAIIVIVEFSAPCSYMVKR